MRWPWRHGLRPETSSGRGHTRRYAQPFDLYLLLGLGLHSFPMGRFGLPVLPRIVGAILGPLAEKQGRRSLQVSGGDLSSLIGGPVSWVAYGIVVVVLLWPVFGSGLRRARGTEATA